MVSQLRACAMWMLLTTPACTFGLDWTYPLAPADAPPLGSDVRPPGDRGEPDGAVTDSGAIDTGAIDTGPGPMGGCGDPGERCCSFGVCGNNRVCVTAPGPMMTRVCEVCGGDNQRCCAFGLCGSGRICTQRTGDAMPLCRDCGEMGQPCCFNRACDSGRRCEMRMGEAYATCR